MYRRTIVQNTLMLTGANLALRTVSMLFQVYLSNLIGAAGMGLLQLALTAGGFAATLANSGLRVAAMYLTAEEFGHGRDAGVKKAAILTLGVSLLLSTAVGGGFAAAAPQIAAQWIRDVRVIPALRLLGFFLPASCLTAVLSGYFTARGCIRPLVAVEMVERIACIALTAVLLRFWAGHDAGRICSAVVGGSGVTTVLSLFALLILLWRNLRGIRGAKRVPMGRRLARLCIPLALGDYLRSGLSTLEHFLIPRGLMRAAGSYENSLAAYGTIHGMVFPLLMFPAALFYSLSDLLVPELARCRAKGSTARIRSITERCLGAGILFSAGGAGFLFLLAPALGELVYHSAAAGRYLRLFAPLVLMLYMDAMTDGMLKGLGQQVFSVRLNTVTSALDVAMLLLLLPRLGIAGYFVSFTVSHAVNFYLSLARLARVTGASICAAPAIRAIMCAAGAAAFGLFAAPPAVTAISVVLSGGVYLGVFSLAAARFGGVSPRELWCEIRGRKC